MAGPPPFSDQIMRDKLEKLDRGNIETLTRWIFHHRKHADRMAKTIMETLMAWNSSVDHQRAILFLISDLVISGKGNCEEVYEAVISLLPGVAEWTRRSTTDVQLNQLWERLKRTWLDKQIFTKEFLTTFNVPITSDLAESSDPSAEIWREMGELAEIARQVTAESTEAEENELAEECSLSTPVKNSNNGGKEKETVKSDLCHNDRVIVPLSPSNTAIRTLNSSLNVPRISTPVSAKKAEVAGRTSVHDGEKSQEIGLLDIITESTRQLFSNNSSLTIEKDAITVKQSNVGSKPEKKLTQSTITNHKPRLTVNTPQSHRLSGSQKCEFCSKDLVRPAVCDCKSKEKERAITTRQKISLVCISSSDGEMDVAQGDNAISGKSGSDSDEDIRPVNVRCAENEEKTKVIRKHLGRRGRPPAQRELRGEKRKRSNSKQPTTQHSIKSIQCGRISRIAPVKTDFKTEAEALSWLLVNLEKLLLKAVPSVDSMGLKIKSEMIPVKIVNVSEQLNNSITGPDIEVVAEICKIKRGGDSVLKRLLKEKRKQIVDLTEMVRSTKAERDGLSNLVIGMQKLLAPALQDEEKMSLLPSNSYNNNIEIPPEKTSSSSTIPTQRSQSELDFRGASFSNQGFLKAEEAAKVEHKMVLEKAVLEEELADVKKKLADSNQHTEDHTQSFGKLISLKDDEIRDCKINIIELQEKNESLEKKVFELSQNFQNLSEERNRLRTELDKYVVVTIDGEDTAGQSGMDSIMWSESVAVGDIARNNDSFNILHDDRQKIMQLRLELTVLQKEKDDLTDELRKARLSNQSIGTIPAFLDQPPTSLLPPLKVREEMEKMKDENRKLREQLDNVKPKNITTKLENKMKDDCEESEIDWKIKYNTEVPVLLSQIRQLRELLQDSADRMAQQEKIIAENTTLQQQLQKDLAIVKEQHDQALKSSNRLKKQAEQTMALAETERRAKKNEIESLRKQPANLSPAISSNLPLSYPHPPGNFPPPRPSYHP